MKACVLAVAFIISVSVRAEGPPPIEHIELVPNNVRIKREKLARAVQYHIKNLGDSDADVRQSSIEMLAALGATRPTFPALIAVLDPCRHEQIAVEIAALNALRKLTNNTLDFRDYDAWKSWWDEESKLSDAAFVTQALAWSGKTDPLLLMYSFWEGPLVLGRTGKALKIDIRESGVTSILTWPARVVEWSMFSEAANSNWNTVSQFILDGSEMDRLLLLMRGSNLIQNMETIEQDIAQEIVSSGHFKSADYDGAVEILEVSYNRKSAKVREYQFPETEKAYPNVPSVKAIGATLKEIVSFVDKHAPKALGQSLAKLRGEDAKSEYLIFPLEK